MAKRAKTAKRKTGTRTAKKRAAGKAKAAFRPPAGWRLDRGGKSMSIDVRAHDFADAMAILNAVAEVAEEVGHHPDFHLEEYNRVRISTWSHDVGRLTERDRNLAARITALLKERSIHMHASS